jgi:iron(II)-dependent oxidoreductase
MMSRLADGTLDRRAIAARLAAVRERTLLLVSVLDWPTLRRQQIPILSPMVWDLGHIGHFEEEWLARRLTGDEPLHDGFAAMFDPQQNPRPTREALPLPGQHELTGYLERVRDRTLRVLAQIEIAAAPDLLRNGLVYELVAEHEEQHQETLLQAMQVLDRPAYPAPERRPAPTAATRPEGMAPVPAGPFEMGLAGDGFAYDNERPRHRREIDGFEIDRAPTTHGEYLEFVEAGGYHTAEHWSEAGWEWCRQRGAEAPRNWTRRDRGWCVRWLDREMPLPTDLPVTHVCYWEAEAYASFAGKRLPTEAEWEKAALWDPEAGRARRYPWGDAAPEPHHANLDQLLFGPAPVGAYPAGVSAYGVHQMVGDVWEWTSSDFTAYPGFAAHPYPEYSEIFFGSDYRVLRGGSWATRPAVARGTFRNWDFPIRRQIFAGLRCARDRREPTATADSISAPERARQRS